MNSEQSVERALQLVGEIARLARAHDNKALLEINGDPETESLLAALPAGQSKQAMVHLEGARIWRKKMNRKAQDKFDAAAKALEELDLVLARGILRKTDPQVLDEEGLARYDELSLAIEARGVELDDINSRLPQEQTESGKRSRRGFFKRSGSRRGSWSSES